MYSPKPKQHTELCFSNKFEHEEEVRNIRIVEQQEDRNNHAATSSVGHSEIPVAENTPEPLLTASQEEYILNELSIEQSNTQQTVNNFYNCTFNF